MSNASEDRNDLRRSDRQGQVLLFIIVMIGGLVLGGLLPLVSYAQAPDFLWAKSAKGIASSTDYEYDVGIGIAVDQDGNAYVTGYFSGSSISFGSITLSNAGKANVFVAKYDQDGNVLWAKGVGGPSYDFGGGIAVDKEGNANVTGNFSSSSISFGSTTLSTAGGADVFVAKLGISTRTLMMTEADRGDGTDTSAASFNHSLNAGARLND